MNKTPYHLTLAATLCLLMGGAHAEKPQPDPLTEGKSRFMADCAACHGATGMGDGPAAGALHKPPSDLTRLAAGNDGEFPTDYVRRVVDGRDFQQLAHGNVEMPVWGNQYRSSLLALSEQRVQRRINALVVYLQSIQTK